MSAEIISLADMRPSDPNVRDGNGASEALIDIVKDLPFRVPDNISGAWADQVLMELWSRGFKVVPLEPTNG